MSKYVRLLQQLRHGGVTHAAILQYNKENEFSQIRGESFKGKQNAYAWLKKNVQKTIGGFVKLCTNTNAISVSKGQWKTICDVDIEACKNKSIQQTLSPEVKKKAYGEDFDMFALGRSRKAPS